MQAIWKAFTVKAQTLLASSHAGSIQMKVASLYTQGPTARRKSSCESLKPQICVCSSGGERHGSADLLQPELPAAADVPPGGPPGAVLCVRHPQRLHGRQRDRPRHLRPLPHHPHGKPLSCLAHREALLEKERSCSQQAWNSYVHKV